MSAAFTAAIHVALLTALLTFRPDLADPVDPARPLAVDLVPAPPPEPPVVEPVAIEEPASIPSRQPAGRPDPGAAAPRALRPDMDRTLADVSAPAFPPGPVQATGQAPDGEAGTGSAGAGTGAGAGGSGTGPGSGAGSRAALDAPHWIAKPTWSQMKLHNPRRAAAERVSGTALLACRIDSRHRARNCRILSEAPRGYGFGSAALAAVRLGRIRPALRDGLPAYEAWVGIPITFRNCSDSEPGCVDSSD